MPEYVKDMNAINWDMVSFFASLVSGTFVIVMFAINPLKKHVVFIDTITKAGNTYNYNVLHAKVEEMHEFYKLTTSPEVKDLKAKIRKLEDEKEAAYKQGFAEIKQSFTELREDFNDLKVQVSKRNANGSNS